MEDIAKLFEYNVLVDREEYRNLITTQQKYTLERKKMHEIVSAETDDKYNRIIRDLKDKLADKDIEIEKIKAKSARKCTISIIINIGLIAIAALMLFAEA